MKIFILCLFLSSPRDHEAAARFAELITGVSHERLLAIAWHESRFTANVITREPGGRVSCGALTPVPHRSPCSRFETSLVGGYLTGAVHWKQWLSICRGNEWCADLAYGGGLGLVRACRRGHVFVRRGVDACDLHHHFRPRSHKILDRVISARVRA